MSKVKWKTLLFKNIKMNDQKIVTFLNEIKNKGIRIVVKNGDLDIKAPKGVMTKEIIAELKDHKTEIITYLSGGFVEKNKIDPVRTDQKNYPISSAQRRLWILSQFEDGSIAFNIPSSINLSQNIDIECFKKAIDQTIARHEILRTVFKEDENGEIKQWILSLEDLGFQIDFLDFRTKKLENPQTYIAADSYKPFDLENGPLLRAALLQVDKEEYVFYFNMHHIISDGWSMEVLAKDVFAYYDANVSNENPTLSPLTIQYKDYSVWQLAQLEGESFKAHKEYWLETFSGDLPLLDLPSYNPRPKIKTHNGQVLNTYLDRALTSQLKKYVAANGGSPFMAVLSAWNVLMYHYTQQTDCIIGTPVAGRDHADLENQIGFYVNTLALRNELDPEENFASFYLKVKNNTLKSYNHQAYPFDRLVEDLTLERDTSRNPIFDISITYHNITQDEFTLEDKALIDQIISGGASKVKSDIELHFNELGEYMSFSLIYNEDVYDQRMIEGLMRHFKGVLSELLHNPEKKVCHIDYLTLEEKNILVEAAQGSKIDFPQNVTIIDLFESQVSKTPEHIALIFEETTLTYLELNKRSNQLAQFLLQNYAFTKGELIGIQLDRSEQMIIAILAVLKAGGAYVPIDPEYPSARKEFIMQDSALKLLITEANFVFDIDYYNGDVLAIDVEFEADNYSDERPSVELNSNDLTYVIYTSGSTGEPKGVMIEQHAIVNTLLAQIDGFEVNANSIGLQFASFSFDASVSETFIILLAGGTLCIVNEQDRKDPKALAQFISDHAVNMATLPPSYLSKIDLNTIGLDKLITAGEVANVEKALEFLESGTFYNAYGPTEASICGTLFRLEKKEDILFNNVPIGKPIANTSIYVLNENEQLLPDGVVGEICIGGAGIASGYLNRQALTNEKFGSNPYVKGERIYKTGDLGRWLPDGNLQFIGRKDDQVKVKGYRIELGEIEHALLSNGSVKTALVLAKPNENNENELVAYITSTTEENVNDLRAYLSERLPAYMLPTYFVQLDEFPLTPNGKIDKKALPNPEGIGLKLGTEYVAPSSEEEKILVSVWKDVLKREKIGVKDSFYNLGGDSIKSIQVVSRLKQQGFTLKVENILRTPLLEELAKLMEHSVQLVNQAEVTGKVEFTPIQHWFFESNEIKVHNHYNQSVLLKSNEEIDEKMLEQCIVDLTAHHDALRMIYKENQGTWEQENQPINGKNYVLEFHDLRESADVVKEISQIGERLQSSIDLSTGPLFKVVHFRLKDGDRIGLILHHLVADGVSWRILFEDLTTLYSNYKSGEGNNLALKTDSFQSWAFAQKEYANSQQIKQERSYWQELSSQEIQGLPRDKSAENNELSIDSSVSFVLDKDTTELLQTKVHHVYNTEINDILLTSLGLAIKEAMAVDKTVLKMEGHGREDIVEKMDITRTIGWFTTVYPFVLDVSRISKRLDNLIGVKEDLRKVPNKGIGYGILKHLTEDGITGELRPEIVFNYLGDFGTNVSNESESLFEYAGENLGRDIAKANLNEAVLDVSGMLLKGELNMVIGYSSSRYHEETMQKLKASFKKNLELLIAELSETSETYLTPSDLSFKGLTQEEFSWINSDNSVLDVYELSPLQEGMYYHWLFQESNLVYFEQLSYRIRAKELQIEHLKKSYDKLVARHAVLRTSFSNDYARRSLQIVRKEVPSNFTFETIENKTDKQSYVNHIKQKDREKGFDLNDPSQMRMHVIKLDEGEYEFIWSHHHILMDGWCMSILINDFNELLSAEIVGKTANLPPVVPYSNYINWIKTIDKDNSREFWRNYLLDYSQVVEVPFKRKGEDQPYIEATQHVDIGGDQFLKLDAFCTQLGITHNTFMQGVWGYLLSRYNNTHDVVYGAVVSGRPADLNGVEDMIGLFVNTIPVRVKYETDTTPSELLERLQQQSIESTKHHFLNLSEVQAQSELRMDLINHILVFENYAVKEIENEGVLNTQREDGLFVESMEINDQSNYDLNVTVYSSDISLRVEIIYNGNTYESESLKGLMRHLENLIGGFVECSEDPLVQLDYLTEKEKQELQIEFNSTKADYPTDASFVELFEIQVSKTPDNMALVYEDIQLTYREINERSNQLANYLKETSKISSEDLIGIQLDRSQWLVISILGVLKAGGAYVPIDPDLPAARKEHICNDTGLKLIITESSLLFDIDYYDGKIFAIDIELDANNFNTENIGISVSANQLAYVIYTSGSTGQPKGVMVEHAALLNLCFWHKEKFVIKEEDRATLYAGVSFDASVWELFPYLLSGACLHIIPPKMRIDPELLNTYYEEHKITISFLPTQMAEKFLELENNSLRYLLIGGDKLNNFKAQSYTIVNNYGPTENTVVTTSCIVESNQINIPIGKPISNSQIYILNENQDLQPLGVVGEICVSGASLSRGYLNQPDLTKEKFIKHPFLKGARLYRTGDLGRWLPDGNIEFLGRVDDQIKIRGYRVELGEIKHALLTHNEIEEAAVIIIENQTGSKEIVAYLTAKNEQNTSKLRDYLKGILPNYMLPANFVQLKEMPLNASGKINKKLLPSPDGIGLMNGSEYVPPSNETEETLAGIWEMVLGVKKIGVLDDFFELGGHSLRAMGLVVEYKNSFKVGLTLQDIYDNPTIKAHAEMIGIKNWIKDDSDSVEQEENQETFEF